MFILALLLDTGLKSLAHRSDLEVKVTEKGHRKKLC